MAGTGLLVAGTDELLAVAGSQLLYAPETIEEPCDRLLITTGGDFILASGTDVLLAQACPTVSVETPGGGRLPKKRRPRPVVTNDDEEVLMILVLQ